ncbi:MAG: ABC transporter permease [Sulfurospirillaceae bacterium]|nr:ABC transporter permease [Sulfurospirillaceae bacterium]
MRLRVIKAYFIKEILELIRTRVILMPLLMPLIIVVLFGFGIKMQVTGARVLIIDHDNSNISRTLISKFEHSKYFNSSVLNLSEKQAMELIKKAKEDVVIIIPSSFEKNVLKGYKSELGVFVDGSFPSRASTIDAYIQGVVFSLADDFKMVKPNSISLDTRNMFNQSLRDAEMVVPGLLGLVLFVSPAILTALLIAREKEKGTIFNFYSSSVTKQEFLSAKLSSVFCLQTLNIFILFLVASYLFNLPFRGSFFLYWLSSEVYIMISLCFGLLVSIIASSQIVAVILSLMFTILPGFLYSGMLMPISSMSGSAYIIAHIYPVMYYNHIVYDAFLIGQGFSSSKVVTYLVFLCAYAVVLYLLGLFLLKKETR